MADPTWLLDLQPASFRGVPFKVFSHSREGGLRGPDHEYPQRDTGAPENTGNKLERWRFEAFVIGDVYHEKAEDLIAALKAGKGELVHPRWGRQIALCRSWVENEDLSNQGIARFSLEFVDASEELGVAITIAGDEATKAAADDLKTAVKEAFADAFTVSGFSGSVVSRALSDLNGRVDALTAAARAPLAGALAEAETFFELVDDLATNLATLVFTPSELADDVVEIIESIGDLEVLRAFTVDRPASLTDGITLPSDPSEAAILTNADAVSSLFQRAALAELAVAAAVFDWTVYDDAIAARDEIAEAIEVEELLPTASGEYDALVLVRVELVATIYELAEDLARLRDYRVTRVTSTLQMAWELYADAERADEIGDRNQIRHPGFVPPGVYRVLTE